MFKSLTNSPHLKISIEQKPEPLLKNDEVMKLLGKRKKREAVVEDDGEILGVTEEFIPTSKPKEK